MLVDPLLWAITSPRRMAVGIVLALLEDAPELVAELSSAARYTVHRRLPWHAHGGHPLASRAARGPSPGSVHWERLR